MNGLAQVAALIGAATYIGAAQLEMFLFERPFARRFLHVHARDVGDVRMWAFVVGVRNTLAGLATVIGVVMLHTGSEATGQGVGATNSTSSGIPVSRSLTRHRVAIAASAPGRRTGRRTGGPTFPYRGP